MTVCKCLRLFSRANSYIQVGRIGNKQSNIKFFKHYRNLYYSSNLYAHVCMEYGNKYAYSIMENKGYIMKLNTTEEKKTLSEYSLQDMLKQNWSQMPPKIIFDAFPVLGELCSKHNLCISNEIFDDFIDILTDNLIKADNTDLRSILCSLLKWPPVQFSRTRNFIEVWVALEDEYIRRIKDWTYNDMFSYMRMFYLLNIIGISEFPRKCLLRLASKAKHLTPAQLVQTMFFIGVRKYSPDDIHNLEVYVNKNFDDFTVDDLAIISMGFYKSKTPIRSMELVGKMIDKVKENSTHIHQNSLVPLLMVIHYSVKKFTTDNQIYTLLDNLLVEVPRLSVLCNVYIGLLGTSTLTLHEGCLDAIANKVSSSIADTRIKDLERLVFTFSVFNYKPKCEDIFLKIIDELKKPEREIECGLHGGSFASCVASLGSLGIYDKELLKRALDPKFLEKTYGKYCISYRNEILTLHNISKIFFKNENISQLSDKEAILLARKYTCYVPNEEFKKPHKIIEKVFLDVLNILKESRGGDGAIGSHILTHHYRGDIILCNDGKGSAVSVGEAFSDKYFGLLRTPPDNNTWVVLIIAGKDAIIPNTKRLSGQYITKIRELNALGFYAEMVIPDVLEKYETKEAKLEYLNNLIIQAVKKVIINK